MEKMEKLTFCEQNAGGLVMNINQDNNNNNAAQQFNGTMLKCFENFMKNHIKLSKTPFKLEGCKGLNRGSIPLNITPMS